VETSTALQAQQADLLKSHPRISCGADWPEPESLEPGGVIVLGNEFLDALPVEQFVFHDGAWRVRCVGLDGNGDFAFVAAGGAFNGVGIDLTPAEGDVFEACGGVHDVAHFLSQHAQAGCPVAALFVDYGHGAPGFGDTLQGVKAHRHVSPFEAAGDTDLSAQVDFATAARVIEGDALAVEPLTTQGEFLGALGIMERASKLMAANPQHAAQIEAGVARLMAPNGMGTRFKVLGARSTMLAALPGFSTP
jgi:NADH dehydrogenase [ubiquinone] 1 alpha subcomplex assembly factor 7